MRKIEAKMVDELLTVVVPVKDEEKNIARFLEVLSSFSKVIVVDSGSSDRTVEIARDAGAVVFQFEWNGKFPKKRNWSLRNCGIQTDWVLFLDADEYVTPAFVQELEATLPISDHVGFWLNFENHFMGKKLRGGEPFRKLALFRVGSGEYEEIREDRWSQLDMEVHEHPILNGTVGEIKSPIAHNDDRGLHRYIGKHNEYSSWEAQRYWKLVCEGHSGWERLTLRQSRKYKNMVKWWFAPAYFLNSYFLRKGFLDGSTGFHFALMKAIYFYQIRLKVKEIRFLKKQMG